MQNRGSAIQIIVDAAVCLAAGAVMHSQFNAHARHGKSVSDSDLLIDGTPPPPAMREVRKLSTQSQSHAAKSPSRITELSFDPPETDLGEVEWGTQVPFELVLVNELDKELRIANVRTSCGCTTLNGEELAGKRLQPKERVYVSGTLDAEYHPGHKQRTVTVESETGGTATAVISAKVIGTFAVQPAAVDFGPISIDAEDQQSPSYVVTFTSSTYRIAGDPTSDVDWLDVTAADRLSGQTDILITLRLDRLSSGISTASVYLPTNDNRVPPAVIPVRVRATHSLISEPASVFLRGSKSQLVVFLDLDHKPVRITKAICHHDNVIATITSEGNLLVRNPLGTPVSDQVLVKVVAEAGQRGRVRVACFPPLKMD